VRRPQVTKFCHGGTGQRLKNQIPAKPDAETLATIAAEQRRLEAAPCDATVFGSCFAVLESSLNSWTGTNVFSLLTKRAAFTAHIRVGQGRTARSCAVARGRTPSSHASPTAARSADADVAANRARVVCGEIRCVLPSKNDLLRRNRSLSKKWIHA